MKKRGIDMEALEKEFDACWKEFEDAPPLSDEEIDRIIKDVRKSICQDQGNIPPLGEEELDQIIKDVRRSIRQSESKVSKQ